MKLLLLLSAFFYAQFTLALDTPKKFGIVKNSPIEQFTVKYLIASVGKSGEIEGIGQCTGTFINRKTMLTAAHCVSEKIHEVSPLIIVSYLGGEPQEPINLEPGDYTVEAYPGYYAMDLVDERKAADLDMALIHFKGDFYQGPIAPLYNGEKLSPMYMPSDAQYYAVGAGSKAYFIWDPLKDVKTMLDGFLGDLRGAYVDLKAFGQSVYFRTQKIGYRICVGDSGGPLFVYSPSQKKVWQIGVHSRGPSIKSPFLVGQCSRELLATGVTGEKRGWIKSQIEKYQNY